MTGKFDLERFLQDDSRLPSRVTTPSTPHVADDVSESGEFVLVPREPTEAMMRDGLPHLIGTTSDVRPVGQFWPGMTADESEDANWRFYGNERLKRAFSAMLAASPSPQHIGDAGGVEPTYWHNGAGQVMTHASREALRGTTDEDMLGRFDEPLYALPPARVEAEETQESIGAWADEVFGPVSDLPRAVGRAGEELAELKEAAETLTPQDMIVEMADVVIVLMRLANVIGQDLGAAINAKMAVNRKRTWNSDGTGHGYHVKPALQSEPK